MIVLPATNRLPPRAFPFGNARLYGFGIGTNEESRSPNAEDCKYQINEGRPISDILAEAITQATEPRISTCR